MKLQLSRRDFSLTAANMIAGSLAGGSLFGAASAWAQSREVNLGTFGSIDVQNYIRAKGLGAKTFGPNVKTEFVTVQRRSAGDRRHGRQQLDICNVGSSSPMVVGFAQGVKMSMVYVEKNITDSECLAVRNEREASRP